MYASPFALTSFLNRRIFTVAERPEACIVFARSEAGIMGSNPTQCIDVWYVYEFILCLGRGLATI
jgi:hypothetical protein